MDNFELMNPDDYGLPFSEDVAAKIQAVFAEGVEPNLKAYAANVLIGNVPAAKLNENVGERFALYGYHVKDTSYQDGHTGKYTTLFGTKQTNGNSEPCAFASASDKIYNAVTFIAAVYGIPATWKKPIWVKIRMNTYGDNGSGKAYSLEVVGQENG